VVRPGDSASWGVEAIESTAPDPANSSTTAIEDDAGRRVFKVHGKALRIRKTLHFEDGQGNMLLKIQERKLRLRDTMVIEDPAGRAPLREVAPSGRSPWVQNSADHVPKGRSRQGGTVR
jgi:hypothetical protein